MNQTVKEMTILRSMAIVALMVTHLPDYVNLWWLFKIHTVCADICVTLFLFISGYCLASGKKIDSVAGLLGFFKRRAARIYSLYIPALILFFILYEHDCENKFFLFAGHLFGFQLFLKNFIKPYFTIWFIGLIIPCYLFYGVSAYLSSISVKKQGEIPRLFSGRTLPFKNTSFMLIVFYLVLGIIPLPSVIDWRIAFYFPAFVTGVVVAEKKYFSHQAFELRTFIFLAISSLALSLLFYVCKSYALFVFACPALKISVKIAYVCMIPLVVVFAANRLVLKKNSVPKYVYCLSYSSYAIFLFHRPVLSGVRTLLSYLPIENPYVLLILYLLFILPLLVLPVAYVIQKSSDIVIKHITGNRLRQT